MEDRKKVHKKRLRERNRKNGLHGFLNYEVLELMLSYSFVRKDTKKLAKELIERFGSVTDVINAPVNVLTEVNGIGERTAVLLKLFKDVGDFHLREDILAKKPLNSPEDVYDYLRFHYKGKYIEEFLVIYLNSAHCVIEVKPLFTGTIDRSAVYVRELIQEVIELKSTAVILAHNHPSGKLVPSLDDKRVTTKIKKALSHIEVNLIDHLVCSDKGFYSFKEHNLI